MPKINVYLPDELAAAVKRAGIPVSPVCQQALSQAVRSVGAARKVIEAIRDASLDDAGLAAAEQSGAPGLTARLLRIIEGIEQQAAPGELIGTGALLTGLLDEGANLAVGLLASLEVDLDELRLAIAEAAAQAELNESAEVAGSGLLHRLSWPARNAIAVAIEAALELGHNYIGTEHLLLGLVADPASQAGRALRQQGVEPVAARRALTSALAGYAHGRQATGLAGNLFDVVSRLAEVERRLAEIGR
jgi:ATP-dependent Clp protease ATP-binding subunit ClpA/post-segregation antitoxin (ccd killing protein)